MSVNILARYLQDNGRRSYSQILASDTYYIASFVTSFMMSYSPVLSSLAPEAHLKVWCDCVCVCVWFLPPTAPFTSTPTHTHYQRADVCLCVSESQIHVKLILAVHLFLKLYSYWDVCECVHVHSLCVYLSLALFIKVNDWQRYSLWKRSLLQILKVYF